jgi:DNA anti-recombination protein RmuC
MGQLSQNITPALRRELEMLLQARDELKLRIHLAKADAKSEWGRLEHTYRRVEEEIQHAAHASREPLEQLGDAAKRLVNELRQGYARVKTQLHERPD